MAASIAAATSTSLGRTLCSEVEKGSCECENGNQIDEFRAKDAACFMGNDAEGAVRNNIYSSISFVTWSLNYFFV